MKTQNEAEFCKWEIEVLNKIEDVDILLGFITAEKQSDFLHNFADVLFTFEQQTTNQAIREFFDEIDISPFKKNNVDKWMRYEDDITRYYYPPLLDWINSKERKHSQIAFTSGLGRNIARLVEAGEAQAIQKTTDYLMSSEANRVCYEGVMKLERKQAIREFFDDKDMKEIVFRVDILRDVKAKKAIMALLKNLKKKFGVD